MLLLPAALIAAVSNLDNLGVGVALGRDRRVTVIPNLIIAAVTMAGTAAAVSSGRELSTLIPTSTAGLIGATIITGIGAWTVFASLSAARPERRRPIPQIADSSSVATGIVGDSVALAIQFMAKRSPRRCKRASSRRRQPDRAR
jgi:putative Mn2+ efflux pump MntP